MKIGVSDKRDKAQPLSGIDDIDAQLGLMFSQASNMRRAACRFVRMGIVTPLQLTKLRRVLFWRVEGLVDIPVQWIAPCV